MRLMMSLPEACPWSSDAADAFDRLKSHIFHLLIHRRSYVNQPCKAAIRFHAWTMADTDEISLAESPTPLARHKLEPAVSSMVPQVSVKSL